MTTLLFVEDNDINAKMVEAILARKEKYNIVRVKTGEEAINAIEGPTLFDLILCDIYFAYNGAKLIKWLRTNHKDCTVVAFSARDLIPAAELEAMGFSGMISKPIDAKTFEAELDGYLRKTEN